MIASKIFLIGMPGSGKSTFGKQLAQKLDRQFFDIDEQLERMLGMSIHKIFLEIGEDYFREAEEKVLMMLIKLSEPSVIATGGGTPCFFNNMEEMKKAGATIWLDTPLDTVIDRVGAKKDVRPLVDQMPADALRKEITNMYEMRRRYYRKADFTSDSNMDDILHFLDTVRS
ncbi:shikimate kinase [Reichenbachiella versicolor]|uniref:shikimate kinase n=1 Tax=Reichenbachiella versicolor TaxID=1821036 RepID=UPI000D6DE75B|nr:shikimate kinase [Reichenbachiella versicolor]